MSQIRGAIAGGVDVVQVRETGLEARAYIAFLRECVSLTRGTRCQLIVNDRVDLALAAGAHGVHLREDSISIGDVRQLAPTNFVVGRSIHDAASAAGGRSADYLIVGSVFETASKPGQPATLGLDGLRQVADAARPCPVWAVGGISTETVREVKACGISGVAAIGAFLPSPSAVDIANDVRQRTEALRFSLVHCG